MMAHEEGIRELLRQVVPDPVVRIDVEEVRRGAQRRNNRGAVVAAVAVAVVLGAVGFVGLRQGPGRPEPVDVIPLPTPGVGTWQRLPDMPLSPRWDSFSVWTGTEALIIGGSSRNSLGGPATMADLRDGAAFDPSTSTWRQIAPAPTALRAHEPSTIIGDTLVVAHWEDWLAYDIDNNQWRRLPAPPTQVPQPTLAGTDGLVYALDVYVTEGDSAPVQVLDLATNTWSQLPHSSHQPTLDQRTLVATPDGLVVMGDDFHPRLAGPNHEDAHAEIWDGTTWNRFPDSSVQGCCWHWTGKRIISSYRITQKASDRGGPHTFHASALDPATGEWAALPWLPDGNPALLLDTGWPTSDGPLVFANGYIYDDNTGSSEPVHPPDPTLNQGVVVLGGQRLMMVGGYHVDPNQPPARVMSVQPTSEVWMTALR